MRNLDAPSRARLVLIKCNDDLKRDTIPDVPAEDFFRDMFGYPPVGRLGGRRKVRSVL
jgi:hypothetical protein